GEGVVPTRIEVGVQLDTVEDVADELLDVHAGGDADLGAQVAGDGSGEGAQVEVVDDATDPVGVVETVGEQVSHFHADLDERVEGEAREADLHGPRVVEAGVGGEVGVETLGQRGEALHALGSVE